MTLESKVCRHYEPKEYKEIFNEFKRQEPLNYQLIDSYIKDVCLGTGTIRDVYLEIKKMQLKPVLRQAYSNVLESLEERYGTKRDT